ncbi:MAG: glycosyltransferase [Xanthobacteraceae bacterium]
MESTGAGRPGPEIACLRGVLSPMLLRSAAARAAELGIGADQVLLRWGVIDEESYIQRLAASAGLEVEDFRYLGRKDCLLADHQLHRAAESGMLYIQDGGRQVLVVAPRGLAARRLMQSRLTRPVFGSRIRLTTAARLNGFIAQHADKVLAQRASDGLKAAHPELSAAPRSLTDATVWRSAWDFLIPILLCAALIAIPVLRLEGLSVMLSLAFVSFAALRLVACCIPRRKTPELAPLADRDLPLYSVVVALYREARSVAPLVAAIQAIDYPPEKLQIILALEPDDFETRAAVAKLGHLPHVQVVLAARDGPRTKPKALNCALPFVQGDYVAVYDAEDRPEPDQLRLALDAFRMHGPDIACVQASLCITNISDSWLSRTFTAEYAGQFDVFLQGATALRAPLPLGGSSNHFDTRILREVSGWDAYNVTEDADLGLRLARFGYRSVMFPSTTYEEAPARFGAWLKQRTRWMKGWMQTWAVHMSTPVDFWRSAGPRGFLTVNLLVGGNILGALVYPILLTQIALAGIDLADGRRNSLFENWLDTVHAVSILSGLLASMVVGAAGLAQRGLLRNVWILAATPIYWLLLSAAAWRALWQYAFDRYRWEKTEHGLAKSEHFKPAARAGER